MQTQHYGFKLFEAAEKPTWLNDWNTTMTKIDTTIARITSGGGDTPDLSELTQRVQALEGRADSDELRLNVVEGDIVSMLETLSGVQASITSLTSDVSTLRSDLTSGLAGLQTSIDSLSTTVGSLSTALDTLSDRVTTAEGNISQNTSDISDNAADISQNTSDISALDTRVTALEQGGGGGGSSFKVAVVTAVSNVSLQSGVSYYIYNLKQIVATATGDTVNNILGYSIYSSTMSNGYYDYPILRWDGTDMIVLSSTNVSGFTLKLTVIYN